MNFRTTLIAALALPVAALAADKPNYPQLKGAIGKPDFEHALTASLGEADIKKGVAVLGEGPDFIWAVESDKAPVLYVDDRPLGGQMQRVGSGKIWYQAGQLKTGTSHSFHYMVDGSRLGGRNDVPVYGADSYEKPGVPKGKLSEKLVHTSKIYEGMQSDYWIYVPAQYNSGTPAALMVWQDGQGLAPRDGPTRAQIVVDNLIQQKKIPVMIQVFISPGKIGEKAMRSIEYDTVSDQYARFLRDEILAEVQSKYKYPQRRIQPRDRWKFIGRDLFLQRGMAPAGPVQPRALAHRELHQHSMEARRDGRRQCLSVQDSQGTQAQHPRVAPGWLGRPGE